MNENLVPINTSLPLAMDIERVLLHGDLSKLTPDQRITYYHRVCESVGLNPLTKPFDYIRLNGKEVLYAKRDAADQLRKVYNVSVTISAREIISGVYVVTAQALMPSGRKDESTGAVPTEGLKGDNLANAMMKAETKAKRRVTLSICGLGLLDETEVETIPNAQRGALPKGKKATSLDELADEPHVESAPDADAIQEAVGSLLKRIEEIDAIPHAKNWAKAHAAEILALPPDGQECVGDAFYSRFPSLRKKES